MLGFPRFRSKFKGAINPMAYVGMAGDLVVMVTLYVLWKERKKRKALAEIEKEKLQDEENMYILY